MAHVVNAANEDLHAGAEALAAACAVDLARAHRARLAAFLGTPLPALRGEEGKEGRAMERRM